MSSELFDINDPTLTTEQRTMLVELHGLADQIRKRHYLNVHFRAFQLANTSWQEHIRVNAELGSRKGPGTPPYGALLDEPPATVRLRSLTRSDIDAMSRDELNAALRGVLDDIRSRG